MIKILNFYAVQHRKLEGFLVSIRWIQLLNHHDAVTEHVIRRTHDQFTVTRCVNQIALLRIGDIFFDSASRNLNLTDVELNNRFDIENRALTFCNHILNDITHKYLLKSSGYC